jgi:formylglycine-generating enzyme required for sulfatase activity
MKTGSTKLIRFANVLLLAVGLVGACVAAQTPPELGLQTTITGAVGTVHSIEYITDRAQTNTPSAWRCLELLQLPASPYLWADTSAPATGKRFYRATVFAAPTNLVFIPAGTFRMGSPPDEVDRSDDEGPQTAVIISRGFWIGKYEVTQGEYLAVTGKNPSFFQPPQRDGRPESSSGDGELEGCHKLLCLAYTAGENLGSDSDQQRIRSVSGSYWS